MLLPRHPASLARVTSAVTWLRGIETYNPAHHHRVARCPRSSARDRFDRAVATLRTAADQALRSSSYAVTHERDNLRSRLNARAIGSMCCSSACRATRSRRWCRLRAERAISRSRDDHVPELLLAAGMRRNGAGGGGGGGAMPSTSDCVISAILDGGSSVRAIASRLARLNLLTRCPRDARQHRRTSRRLHPRLPQPIDASRRSSCLRETAIALTSGLRTKSACPPRSVSLYFLERCRMSTGLEMPGWWMSLASMNLEAG